MNVACTACPAKYAVPDERVRGKRARITCKHCGTSIIVDGTGLGPSDGSVVAARPARNTMLGMGQVGSSAVAASSPRASSPRASVPSNAPPSGGSAWLVALADGRREPASQARIVDLYSAGTIDAASYIWREGMLEWKTPFQIPEIAGALTARGLKPRQASIPAAGEPDPEEATRVAFNVLDDPVLARARSAAARAATGARKSEPPAPEHDDGITIARSGPPSSPVSLPPLRAPSELSAARSQTPSAVRTSAPPSAEPPARKSSEPLPAAGRRPRAHTLPGDLVIPLTGPAAPPPTPLFAPRGQPFAGRRTPSGPPGPIAPAPSAMVAPSAMIAPSAQAHFSSAPPAPSAEAAFPSAPPAPSLPAAALMAAPSPANLPAPARPAADFEFPPRSAAPVSVPLEFTQGPQRRRRTMTTVVSIGVLALGGMGFAAYWKSKAPHRKPPAVAAAATAPSAAAPAPAPMPSAAEAEPAASVEAEPAAPSAEATKPSARERAAARPAAATARPASARKAEATKPEASEADTEAAAEGDSEAATARAEEAAKKAEMQVGAGTAPFDRDAATTALSDAAMRTVSCRMLGGPTGSAQATVTFAPNGHVTAVAVGGDFAGSVVGACVGKLFRAATVPPFAGDPVTVAKRFTVE